MNPFALRRAKDIAGQSRDDRLDGKQADEAGDAIRALLIEAGLDPLEAVKLLDTYGWGRWLSGSRQTKEAFTAADRGLAANKENRS
jgi:hypothetical protein